MLGLWILMSKTYIKMISIHGGQYMRQLMNPILENLNYFLKRLLSTEKNQNEPQKIPSEIKNNIKIIVLEESVYAQVVIIRRKIMVNKGKKEKG